MFALRVLRVKVDHPVVGSDRASTDSKNLQLSVGVSQNVDTNL